MLAKILLIHKNSVTGHRAFAIFPQLACGWVLAVAIFASSADALATVDNPAQKTGIHALTKIAKVQAGGDIDAIRHRGYLRVLVVPNKTHYQVDRGRQFGLAYDLVRDFETELNKDFPRKRKKYIPAVFIPVHRDEIFTRLRENRGDIAVANLTITKEREDFADFSSPFYENAQEILVSSATAPSVNSIDELSGKAVFIRKSSSFFSHLNELNADFSARNLKPVKIVEADEHLEAEDLLEMLNAGLIDYSIIDRHIGEIWAKVFPNVVLHPEVVVASGQHIAWAIRKSAPGLKELVDAYVRKHNVNSASGAEVFRRYLKNTKWVKGATSKKDLDRFNQTIAYFRKYADRYEFDPLMLAAQGYQESGLNQNLKSRAGAIGVMQLLPSTGKSLKVGDIHMEEANIHAGAKYMRQIIDVYFNDPGIDSFNRTMFAFAAYNAGPQRIQNLRKEAIKLNLDQNKWFDHVETVAAIKIGRETLQYVANISKYYIAYKLITEQNRDGLMSERD